MGIVNTAVFSPVGKKIVTASLDGTAKIWTAKVSVTIPEDIIGWLVSQNIYKLTQKDLEEVGIDFIKVDK